MGNGGRLMKKRRRVKSAMAIITSLTVAGCAFDPAENEPADVYGPPPAETAETELPDDPKASAEPEEGMETFVPDENISDPVYGVPDVSK
jgi:hypothetical protein